MISDQGDSGPSERDYRKNAELARALAARAKNTEVTVGLMSLARRFELLAEFSKSQGGRECDRPLAPHI
jgi:hypothetical protein